MKTMLDVDCFMQYIPYVLLPARQGREDGREENVETDWSDITDKSYFTEKIRNCKCTHLLLGHSKQNSNESFYFMVVIDFLKSYSELEFYAHCVTFSTSDTV